MQQKTKKHETKISPGTRKQSSSKNSKTKYNQKAKFKSEMQKHTKNFLSPNNDGRLEARAETLRRLTAGAGILWNPAEAVWAGTHWRPADVAWAGTYCKPVAKTKAGAPWRPAAKAWAGTHWRPAGVARAGTHWRLAEAVRAREDEG